MVSGPNNAGACRPLKRDATQERGGTEERAPARAYVPAGTSRLVRPDGTGTSRLVRPCWYVPAGTSRLVRPGWCVLARTLRQQSTSHEPRLIRPGWYVPAGTPPGRLVRPGWYAPAGAFPAGVPWPVRTLRQRSHDLDCCEYRVRTFATL